MKLSDSYDGSNEPFQGARVLSLRSIPANARILSATAIITPVDVTGGVNPFAEVIRFTGTSGGFGATKTLAPGTGGWVEVDFHGRRTLAGVRGSNLTTTALQVDMGGAFVEINLNGGLRAPGDTLFHPSGNSASLPSLSVTKVKLTKDPPATPANPDISEVTIRSVPANVSLRFGDLPPFFTRLGEMTGPETTPDFTTALQAFLADAKVENGFYVVPLAVHSDTIARVVVEFAIEFSLEQSVLPSGLSEVVLPFDFSSLPQAQQDVLQVAVPANMRIAPGGATARVTGVFEETRVVFGPTGEISPGGTAEVSPALSQAQPIKLDADGAASAVDLLLTVTEPASLTLDLRDDLDGKPDSASLLPGPVPFVVPGRVGPQDDPRTSGRPKWVSVQLPAEFQFKASNRYWLVLQSVDGEAAWSVQQAAAGVVGLQQTQNGGLSWRDTGRDTGRDSGGLQSAFLRLRRRPERFQMPIELQVGTGEQAIRVSLDRFEPLGRVDLDLGFDEVAQAFNKHLDKSAAGSCAEVEHLLNGDFEQWIRVGDELNSATPISLTAAGNTSVPQALGVAPDGSFAYAAGLVINDQSEQNGVLHAIDVACNKKVKEIDLGALNPSALAINPDGTRAYVAGPYVGNPGVLQVIETIALELLGPPISLDATIAAMMVSPDATRLYLIRLTSNAGAGLWSLWSVLTNRLEGSAVSKASIEVGSKVHTFPTGISPLAMAITPDGARLYVTVGDDSGGEVRIFNAATLSEEGSRIPVGKAPGAIAVRPDGRQVLVANKLDKKVSVIDATTGHALSLINVGSEPTAIAVFPDSTRAFVGETGGSSLIDLVRRTVLTSSAFPESISDLVLTPHGEKLYLLDAELQAVNSIQIGSRLPSEWSLTSGRVTPVCLADPFHIVAALGQAGAVKQMPSAISQVLPVTGSCTFEFSFWGIASEPDAVAEIFWLSDQCGPLKTDRIPVQSVPPPPPTLAGATVPVLDCSSFATVGGRTLSLHRQRVSAPAGATQAEVRFSAAAGVCAVIDRASLFATSETLVNADFAIPQGGQPGGWTITPALAPGFAVFSVEGGTRLRNAGSAPVELLQTVQVKADQPFVLEFQGRATASAGSNPRIELKWLKADGSTAGESSILEATPASLSSSVANGRAPAGAEKVEIHVIVPAGATLEVESVSLKFTPVTLIPVTFIAEAPGELAVSEWRITLEQAEAKPPGVPDKGLCTPTPPDREPGETDCCFCHSCETEQPVEEATPFTPFETMAGRPASVVRCTNCGADAVRIGGPRISAGGRRLEALPTRRPLVVSPSARVNEGREALGFESTPPSPLPLTSIGGIGEVRARKLTESGIDSIDKLAKAQPTVVAQVTGVIVVVADEFIQDAKKLVESPRGTREV